MVSRLLRNANIPTESSVVKTAGGLGLCGEIAEQGLFSKTNNTFGADFSRFGWSDGVSGSDGGAFGSNLVRMVLSRFPLAAGIRTAGFDFTSNLAFVPRFGGQFAVASAVE